MLDINGPISAKTTFVTPVPRAQHQTLTVQLYVAPGSTEICETNVSNVRARKPLSIITSHDPSSAYLKFKSL